MSEVKKIATRDSYGAALVELAKDHPDVVVLDADLAAATKTGVFKKAYPDRTDILDEYQSADIELHNLSNRNEFRKGFKVGAQLVLEMIKPIK